MIFEHMNKLPLVLALAAWTASLALSSAAVFEQLGVFVGNPNPANPAAQAGFDARYTTFIQSMGQEPRYTDVFVDYTQPIAAWPGNAGWGSGVMKGSAQANLIPVVSIGLADSSVYDHGKRNGDRATAMMNAIGDGQYDDVYNSIIEAFKKRGYTSMYFRIGWEMNGGWEPWYATGNAASAAAYVHAFQRVASLAHHAAGITIKTVWCPCFLQWNGVDPTSTYAGDDSVDVVGPDMYSPVWCAQPYDWTNHSPSPSIAAWAANPANREHYWDYPSGTQWKPTSGWGLPAALAFCKEHKKPFALSETGTGGDDKNKGPIDDDAFPAYLGKRLSAAVADGIAIEYIIIWNLNPSDGAWLFTDGKKPKAEIAWREFVKTMAEALATHGKS
ncbi:hypothetical protein SAMN05444156_1730 [Verrucomicrobium sp. GAS474]|uniref:hypothetical protein n=1 Tax=Verrucomicrobium sp. GAS474 TaxID=1882831 RepID=UPI00087A4F44|nr:hypothetical protein [Verrucomicrobium sp. GAS474]SDU06035.1 hypothetical protein SAMN05444156_1730 [Verrucomicrobium sp. GAS474]